MTLREQVYRFEGIDIHASIAMQRSIELRKADLSAVKATLAEKTLKTLMDELDQMYDDLDRHMAAIIRTAEIEKEVKARETQTNNSG